MRQAATLLRESVDLDVRSSHYGPDLVCLPVLIVNEIGLTCGLVKRYTHCLDGTLRWAGSVTIP